MEEELQKSIITLKRGGLLLYPTDTVWGIGCDATNSEAVEKIYALKKRRESKAMICLVSDFKMLNKYVEEVPEVAYDILKHAKKPTTLVYDQPIRMAENLVAEDNSLGIRVVRTGFCHNLIRAFRRPIVSTSANISGEKTPGSFKQIKAEIINSVDYAVNLERNRKNAKPSAVIKLGNDGKVSVVRR